MPRKGTGLQLSISEADKELLEKLAAQLGFLRGTKPNITRLVEAIAHKQMVLSTGKSLTQLEQETLVAAVLALKERAEFKEAGSLVTIARSNFALDPLYLQQIDHALSELSAPWIRKLEEYIEQKQPFQLSYQDASGRIWTRSVYYAEITFTEKRNYLECWCEETLCNRDIPELQHNWSLRLDRIVDAGVVPLEGKWRSGLDTLDVEFELFGGLAHAYSPCSNDVVEWRSACSSANASGFASLALSLTPPLRKVRRKITNSFWFIRSILPYGKDCVVRSPQVIQQKVKEQLEAALQQYS